MGGKNRREKLLNGVWYKFYGKLSVCQIDPRAVQVVLQLHLALDLIHHGPVRQGMHVPEIRRTVHWVLLFGEVQEQGMDDAVPHHDKGPARALPAQCRPACSWAECLTPACPVTKTFVLTGDIGGQGWGRRRAGWRGEM